MILANVVGAMTLEGQKGSLGNIMSSKIHIGTVSAFNELIHKARPHKGQIWTAKQLRSLLHSDTHPSEIAISHLNCGRVQDAYTLRFYPFSSS